jgi:signal transduction histidine kinase
MEAPGNRHPILVRGPERLQMFADRDRVDQVLVNLLSNAIRYSPEGGEIEVRVEPADAHVDIAVKDRGLGVPREHQQTIFERFGRAHGPSFGGLGLGLAITRGIVLQHGGTIGVESTGKPGEGSIFRVRLPRLLSRPADPRALEQ